MPKNALTDKNPASWSTTVMPIRLDWRGIDPEHWRKANQAGVMVS